MSPSSDVVVAARLPQLVALHARPAGRFVRAAASFPCEIAVAAGVLASTGADLEAVAAAAREARDVAKL